MSHHEGTKDTKGSDLFIKNFVSFAFFVVKSLLTFGWGAAALSSLWLNFFLRELAPWNTGLQFHRASDLRGESPLLNVFSDLNLWHVAFFYAVCG